MEMFRRASHRTVVAPQRREERQRERERGVRQGRRGRRAWRRRRAARRARGGRQRARRVVAGPRRGGGWLPPVRRAPQAARGSRARTAPPLRRARSSHESRRRLDESQPLRSARSSSLPSLLLPTETKKETDDNKDQASRYLIFFLQRRGRVECSAGEHEQEITRCYAQALTEGRGSEGEKRERCVAGGGEGRRASGDAGDAEEEWAPRRLARARLRSRYRGASWVAWAWMDASRLNNNIIFLLGTSRIPPYRFQYLRRLPPSVCDLYSRLHVMVIVIKQWLSLFVRKYLFFSPTGKCCDATAINTFHLILVLLYIALTREIQRERERSLLLS
jgi:hypothetical protein